MKYLVLERLRIITNRDREELKKKDIKIKTGITSVCDRGFLVDCGIYDTKEEALARLKRMGSLVLVLVNKNLRIYESCIEEYDTKGFEETIDGLYDMRNWEYKGVIAFSELSFGVCFEPYNNEIDGIDIASFDALDDAEKFMEELSLLSNRSDGTFEIVYNFSKFTVHYEDSRLDVRKIAQEEYRKHFLQ